MILAAAAAAEAAPIITRAAAATVDSAVVVVVAPMPAVLPVATAATADLAAAVAALVVLPTPICTGQALEATADSVVARGGSATKALAVVAPRVGAAVFVRSGSVSFSDCSADAGTLTAGLGGFSALGGFHNGSPGLAAGGALFLTGGNTTFTVSAANSTQTIAGSIAQSGASSVTKAGPGILVLSAVNGYTGGTTINAGVVSISADSGLGASSGSLAINGGALQITGTTNPSTSRAITLGTGGGTLDVANISNTFTVLQGIVGSGALNKQGNGTLVLAEANAYSGGTNINAGILVAAAPAPGGTFNTASPVTVNSTGALQLGNQVGQTNVMGFGGSNPTLNINGGVITTYTGTTHNLGVIHFNGGYMLGSPTPLSAVCRLRSEQHRLRRWCRHAGHHLCRWRREYARQHHL